MAACKDQRNQEEAKMRVRTLTQTMTGEPVPCMGVDKGQGKERPKTQTKTGEEDKTEGAQSKKGMIGDAERVFT